MLRGAILQMALFQRVIPYLEAAGKAGRSPTELRDFLSETTALGSADTAERRVASIVGWLQESGLAQRISGRYVLTSLPASIKQIEYVRDEEPLIPASFELKEYSQTARRTRKQREGVVYSVNQATMERAIVSHQMLIELVARRIREAGFVPRSNRFIDLACRGHEHSYIFEMKSTTNENARQQVRDGVSQLYEYRYRQAATDAHLVLVLQHPLEASLQWMHDYLIEDRGILPVWDGDEQTLSFPPAAQQYLAFLS